MADQKPPGRKLRWISVLMILAAAGAFAWEWHFVTHAIKAQGKIVRNELRSSGGRHAGMLYHPVFTFRDAHGSVYTVESGTGTGQPDYEVGETVPVLYLADQPARAQIDSLFSIWGMTLIIFLFAVLLWIVGVVTDRQARSRSYQSSETSDPT